MQTVSALLVVYIKESKLTEFLDSVIAFHLSQNHFTSTICCSGANNSMRGTVLVISAISIALLTNTSYHRSMVYVRYPRNILCVEYFIN